MMPFSHSGKNMFLPQQVFYSASCYLQLFPAFFSMCIIPKFSFHGSHLFLNTYVPFLHVSLSPPHFCFPNLESEIKLLATTGEARKDNMSPMEFKRRGRGWSVAKMRTKRIGMHLRRLGCMGMLRIRVQPVNEAWPRGNSWKDFIQGHMNELDKHQNDMIQRLCWYETTQLKTN